MSVLEALLTALSFARVFASSLALSVGVSPAWAAPAPMTVPDTMAQRMQACTACHGTEGMATNQGYSPRIAGKPAGYLYQQLVNFRERRRSNATMTYLVEHMSDDYLREIAQYFSSLDLPYPPPQTTRAPAPILAHGEALVRQGDPARGIPACVECHGAAMTGREPAMPGLLGLPRDYLLGQFGAWKTGNRRSLPSDCMGNIAQRLTPDDIRALATWLSSQPVPANSRAAASSNAPLPQACGGVQ